MMIILFYINFFLTPVLGIIFCLNLVAIIKKVKSGEKTGANTFWLTASFTLVAWSIAIMSATGLY